MMAICFRGFTIWVINIALCVYFFTQTFKISDYNRIKKTISNPAFGSSASNVLRKSPTNPKYILNVRTPLRFIPNKSFSFARNEQWENLHNYSSQTLPLDRSTAIEMHRSNQAAKLFEERKRHYEAQQLNYMRYMDKPKGGRKLRSTSEMNGYGMSQRPITGHTNYIDNSQYANKKIREISVPMPDYNSHLYRHDSFDTRPPLRSALRASRY